MLQLPFVNDVYKIVDNIVTKYADIDTLNGPIVIIGSQKSDMCPYIQ